MGAITSSRMAAIDANCEYLGIKSLQLMENAGAAIAGAVKEKISSGKVIVIAGKGNNGGDAFVAARHLKDHDIEVILTGRKEEIKTHEASHNWKALESTSIPLHQVNDSTKFNRQLIKNADIIIDGIFGTGIRGKIREPESTAIDLINESGSFVIAVDVPSGFDPDGGDFDRSVKADLTLTFHRMKTGLESRHAQEYTGEVSVVDIGIPVEAEFFVGPGDIKPFLKRKTSLHKGDSGRVLVIGGGAFSGAPALSALAALRAGADIVTVAAPKSVSSIIASFSPDLIVHPLSGDRLSEDDIPFISSIIDKFDVVAIGMGLGTDDRTYEAIKKIVRLCSKAVIDADALIPDILSIGHKDLILTPHAAEMQRISGTELPGDIKERSGAVKNFAGENSVTVLLKGVIDMISNGEEVFANRTGNAGMTVGGTGDVLAGLVAALYAKHNSLQAACAAAFINGSAGDRAFREFGYGLLASDVINYIPEVMKE